MKLAAFVIVLFLTVGSIVVGKIHWNDKISTYVGMKSTLVEEIEEDVQSVVKPESVTSSSNEETSLEQLTQNLPDELKNRLKNADEEKKPLQFVILGSKSTSSDSLGWPTLFKEKLIKTYGEQLFEISIVEIQDKNSTEVLKENLLDEALSQKPDVLLLEPFILMDNGEVELRQRLNNIDDIVNEFTKANKEIYIFLQPANPLYNATYYPKEVAELERYAVENEYTYLNHWGAWPDYKSSELEKYLSPDPSFSIKSIPSAKGHEVWAEFLLTYFISDGEISN
ncbi:SGNH/GDSL hydrolase family protein [Bacillus sp. DJP31]|uniref:SGNH/GDSL hydrolase family protein n=1 Tax=Bacillus sp. DJP31 TaxID=3409789 RepID=UPI003BB60353